MEITGMSSHCSKFSTMKKQTSDHLEMLFENRNKAYGAYDLRTNYENRLFKSFGYALLIAGLFFLIPYALTVILKSKPNMNSVPTVCIIGPDLIFEKPKPVLTSVKPPAGKLSNATYHVVQKIDPVKEDPHHTDPVSDPVENGTGPIVDSNATTGRGTEVIDSIPAEPMSLANVDVPPSFPGGEKAMMKFLKKNLHYTEDGRTYRAQGRVYVSFIVDEKGAIINASIMRGVGFGLDEEVLRVIGLMPGWIPGKYHNEAVKTALVLPVVFSLE